MKLGWKTKNSLSIRILKTVNIIYAKYNTKDKIW